jgi:hypothetical protein
MMESPAVDLSAVSGCQFAWHGLNCPPWPAPAKDRAHDARCWLCGGLTGGEGWSRRTIPSTFTNHNAAAVPTSQTICTACAYFGAGDTWRAFVAAHPERNLKAVHPLSWRSYHQLFSASRHECPITRVRLRAILLGDVKTPCVLTVSESGQKHLLFRAPIAHRATRLLVQWEEDRIWVPRGWFERVLATVESLYALGFSKDSIGSGRYHSGQLIKVGLAAWRPLEQAMQSHRRVVPDLVRVALYVAQRPDVSETIQAPNQGDEDGLRLRF